jgi:pimeloyl-ACP methyl ester carboxylesterase
MAAAVFVQMGELTQVIRNVLWYALIGYAALTLLIFIFQRKLLYLPGGSQLSQEQARNESLTYWPSYENHRGLIGAQALPGAKGTIIVFHGNAGAAYHRGFYIDALAQHGWRVILAEYPGYGGRDGQPSEARIVDDALETLRLAYRSYGGPLFLWGESLGSGVVAGVVLQTEVPVTGLVLFLPWDSLANLAQTHYWYLPARWLVRDRYNNIDNLRRFEGDIAVMLAGKDEVIPVSHGRKLYDSLNTNKKLWLFEHAGHNSVPIGPHLPWWGEVTDFLLK